MMDGWMDDMRDVTKRPREENKCISSVVSGSQGTENICSEMGIDMSSVGRQPILPASQGCLSRSHLDLSV